MSPFDAGSSGPPPLSDAAYAGILLAVDPTLTGIRVVGWSGPVRDLWVRRMTGLRPGAAIRKMPVGISEDRLLGGLDLAASLAAGRAVYGTGILAESQSGFLILAMAERLSASTAAQLAAAIDGGPGITLIALDEGIGPDEVPPAALLDRLAFTVHLGTADEASWPAASAVAAASRALPRIDCPNEVMERLCALAAMLGVAAAASKRKISRWRPGWYWRRARPGCPKVLRRRRKRRCHPSRKARRKARRRTSRLRIKSTTRLPPCCRKNCSKLWPRSWRRGACRAVPARPVPQPALSVAARPARGLAS
jgi:hypothetical protein